MFAKWLYRAVPRELATRRGLLYPRGFNGLTTHVLRPLGWRLVRFRKFSPLYRVLVSSKKRFSQFENLLVRFTVCVVSWDNPQCFSRGAF